MAITTYATLQTAVSSWLDRTDLTDRAPEFIALAEAQMQRRLNVREMEAISDLTITSGAATIPTGFLRPKSFKLTVYPYSAISYVQPDDPNINASASVLTGAPLYYTAVGTQFLFSSNASGYTARLWHVARFTALSTGSPTNWLLTNHPDAYLYGALLQAAPWLREDERIGIWQGFYETIMEDINRIDRDGRIGASLQPRIQTGVI